MSAVGPHQGPEMGQPSIESARESAITRLRQTATAGSLTLDEYADHAAELERAGTLEDLDAVVSRLPENASAVSAASHHRWLVAVFGGGRAEWSLAA